MRKILIIFSIMLTFILQLEKPMYVSSVIELFANM